LLTGDLLGRIVERWRPGAPLAVPGSPGPLGFEPLCACYGTDLLDTVEGLLQRGRLSMESVLEASDVAPIPLEELGQPEDLALAFTNVNTAEMAERAERLILTQQRLPPGPGPEVMGDGRPPHRWEAW
jgi:molybdopterin-guanine dinucleotide biosynthesis protein A